jgi:hypothetical protein
MFGKRTLQEGKEYGFSAIESLVEAFRLDPAALDDDDEDAIIETYAVLMPVRFEESGELAVSFLLTGYGEQSVWRCVYVCPSLDGVEFMV